MKTLTSNRAWGASLFVMAGLNTLFLFGNGLMMLLTPLTWYRTVPGVTHTGPFNQHFVQDIGLIQMSLGVAFGVGMFHLMSRFPLWTAATVWLCAHALLHFWEVAIGICPPSVIARDFPAVTLPALFGIVLSIWSSRSRPYVDS